MPAVGRITLDIKDYEKKLAEARKEGQKFAQQSSQDFKQVGQGASKAGSLISAMSSEAGGAFGKLGGIIGAIASGPVVALTAAFGALVAVGVDLWDKLTLSTEEYQHKLDLLAQSADKNRAVVEKQAAEDAGYMERLQELAEKETLSNEAKTEAATLIKNLTSRYGDLGLSIDDVTGSIKGADEAQKRFLERQKQMRMQALREQIAATRRQARTQAKVAVKEGSAWGRNARESNVNALMSSAPIETQIKMAEKYRDSSKTQADMDRWQKTIDLLTKQRDLQREYNNLAKTGSATEKENNDRQQKQTAKDQKKTDFIKTEKQSVAYQDLINRGMKEEAERLKLISELKKQGIKLTKEEADEIIRQRQQLSAGKFFADSNRQLEQQAKIQELVTAGKLEEARRLQIINDLLKAGVTYNAEQEQQINSILDAQNRLNSAKLGQAQKQQAESLYDRALRAAGKNREADTRAALESAKKAKGGELTEDERTRTLELLDLTRQLDDFKGASFGNLAVQTNSLTARGGFASGAVVPNAEKYAKTQAENGKSILNVVQRIEAICSEIGKF